MDKNEKKVIARVGNFMVTEESCNGMDLVSVKAVSGFWTVRFREDNAMFGTLRMMAKDERLHQYLEGWITALYVLGNTTPDLDFFKDFHTAYDAMNKRRHTEHTEAEDKAALEDVRAMEEMKEEIENER